MQDTIQILKNVQSLYENQGQLKMEPENHALSDDRHGLVINHLNEVSRYIDQQSLHQFVEEVNILSHAIGQKVRSVSLHNPTSHGQYPLFNGFVNAYDTKLFSDSNYISDSCFSFREKNPFEFIKGVDKSMIQILLHPLHYTNSGGGYDEIMVNSFERRMKETSKEFSTFNKVFKEQVGGSLVKLFRNS